MFVNDNGQEIMYYYMNDGDETSWIPPETDGPFKIELKLNLIASNAQSITVPNSGKELYITKEFLEANYTKNGGYTGTAQEIDDRVVSALGKEDGKFPLTEAVKGNVYYFTGNKKFYICKESQSRRVSVPDGNFEELSIWENRKKLENLISSRNEGRNTILKIGNVVIENITIPGNVGIRTAILKTSFKSIISVSLTPYITYGQQVDSIQSIHDSNSYILSNKSLRFYCNGNQTVDICVIGLI